MAKKTITVTATAIGNSAGSLVTSLNVGFTLPAGSNAVAVAVLPTLASGGADLAVSWNSSALTKVVSAEATTDVAAYWFLLTDATPATADVEVTATDARQFTVAVLGLANVESLANTATDLHDVSSASPVTLSMTLATEDGGVAMAATRWRNSAETLSFGAGETGGDDQGVGSQNSRGGYSYKLASGASVTLEHTLTASTTNRAAMAGISLEPEAVTPTAPTPPPTVHGRRPVTLCELKQKTCSLTYGSSPCTAAVGVTGSTKCFNTRATCQDLDNFDETAKTLRLVEAVEGVPLEWDAIPSLRSVTIKPARINFAGLLKGTSPLGVRGAVTVSIQDHRDGDSLTDPYLADRTYDPATRGTFWGKWIARNQDWTDLEVGILTGDLDTERNPIPETFTTWSGLNGTTIDGPLAFTVPTLGGGAGIVVDGLTIGETYRIGWRGVTNTVAEVVQLRNRTATVGGLGDLIEADIRGSGTVEFVATDIGIYIRRPAASSSTISFDAFWIDGPGWRRRAYFLEEVTGPDSNGRVSLSCRDILSRADGKKAQIPKATDGTLDAAITDVATSLTIALPGVDPDLTAYAQVISADTDGLLQIGDEIMRYSGRSDDSPVAGKVQFFSLTRGLYGTTAEAHDAGDKVQWGREWIDVKPFEVVADALEYWGDIPSSWIDRTAWEAEHARWMTPYDEISGAVVDPIDVDKFVAEVLASAPAYIWTDVAAERIRFRAVRAANEEIIRLDDDGAFLEGTPTRKVEIDEQVSRVDCYFNLRDLTEDLDKSQNYSEARIIFGEQFGRPRVRTIYSRWLKTDVQALQTGRSVLLASNVLPVYVTARVGTEYVDTLGPGSVVRVDSRLLQDATGAPAPSIFLVVQAGENADGTELQLTLRTIGAFPTVSNYASDSVPDYATATDEQKEENAFYTDDDGRIDGADVPYVYS